MEVIYRNIEIDIVSTSREILEKFIRELRRLTIFVKILIYPIRGKIKNPFKCSKQEFFNNEEVQGITQIIFGQEYRKGLTVQDCRVEKVIFLTDADADGAHISALLLRIFLMYFPFMIEAGMIYKAIPPLYSIPHGKRRKYFVDNSDYVKYIQKSFIENNSLTDLKKNKLTNRDITKLIITNADYIYYLEQMANTYILNPYLLEMVLMHYVANKDSIKIDKLRKEITSVFKFMDVKKEKDTITIIGSIESSNFIPFSEKFINDCHHVIELLKENESTHFILNGKKVSLYTVMQTYESYTPNGRQRYKGLGEMDNGELGESVLHPNSDRTLIRYTIEDAKEAIAFVREYESNPKKILQHTGIVNRQDLLD